MCNLISVSSTVSRKSHTRRRRKDTVYEPVDLADSTWRRVGQERSGLEESGNIAGDGAKNNPGSIIRLSKVRNEKTN